MRVPEARCALGLDDALPVVYSGAGVGVGPVFTGRPGMMMCCEGAESGLRLSVASAWGSRTRKQET